MSPDAVEQSSWQRIVLDGQGLLRRPVADDVPGLFAVHRDPAVYRHDPQETHPDAEHTARFLSPMLAHWAGHGFGYWTILVPRDAWPEGEPGMADADGDRVIAGLGGPQFHTLAGRSVLNVSYRLAPAAQGRGLAGLVLQHAIRIAPHIAPGTDLVVRTRPANTVARHVAERAGFNDQGLEPGTTDMQLLIRGA